MLVLALDPKQDVSSLDPVGAMIDCFLNMAGGFWEAKGTALGTFRFDPAGASSVSLEMRATRAFDPALMTESNNFQTNI